MNESLFFMSLLYNHVFFNQLKKIGAIRASLFISFTGGSMEQGVAELRREFIEWRKVKLQS